MIALFRFSTPNKFALNIQDICTPEATFSIQPEIPELLERRPIGRKVVIFPRFESFSLRFRKFRVETQLERKVRTFENFGTPCEIPENAVPFVTGRKIPEMQTAIFRRRNG